MTWQTILLEMKWSIFALVGWGFTVPSWLIDGDLPEAGGVLGAVVLLFSLYKMSEHLKMKKELHREKIRLIRELREGKLEVDGESKELLKVLMEED